MIEATCQMSASKEVMMRTVAASLAVVLVLFLAASATAHAPKKVDLEFDLEEMELEVEVQHQVTDAGKHYINQVTVELNGKKIIEQKISEQEDLKSQTLEYRITDAKVGDTITVSAGCNISGKQKASLEVAPPPEEEQKEDD
jgi:hypothetical protein